MSQVTVPKEVPAIPQMKFYLFYRYKGGSISMKELTAKTFEDAERKAKLYLSSAENMVKPIEWAYLVVADVGKILVDK